nr:hypothetical protein BaRGS_014506 [Batillaria attramentaria]
MVTAVWPAFPSQSGIGNAPLGASMGSMMSAGRTGRSSGRGRASKGEVSDSCTCLHELQMVEARGRDNSDRLDKLQEEVSSMYGAISTLKSALNAVQGGGKSGNRIAPQAYNIAFSARVGYNRPYLGETEVIVFDELVINNGDVYDPYSGKFTSPVPGLYEFQTTILSGFNSTIETMVVMNGNEVSRMFSGGFNTRGSGSNAVLLNMDQGDEVWISVFYGNGDYVHGQWSTFSGHLVQAYTV